MYYNFKFLQLNPLLNPFFFFFFQIQHFATLGAYIIWLHKVAGSWWPLPYMQNQLYMGCQMVCAKCMKNSLWNAFIWKKSKKCWNNESKLTFNPPLMFHPCSSCDPQMHLHCMVNTTSHTSPRTISPNSLLKEEKVTILNKFGEHKLTKERGFCLSNKAKINDCTHTFKAIENETSLLHIFTLSEFDILSLKIWIILKNVQVLNWFFLLHKDLQMYLSMVFLMWLMVLKTSYKDRQTGFHW